MSRAPSARRPGWCAGLAAALLGAAVGLVPARAAGQDPPAAESQRTRPPQAPVHLTAEEAEYRNSENLAVFIGKVVAVQADTTLTADRMEVRFSPAVEQESPAGAASGGRRITSITALGAVTFRQVDAETKKERYATGERGDYDAAAQTLTLTGNPRLWEGKNVLTGERVVFHLDTKLFTAQGKVNMTVFPDEAPSSGGKR